MAAPSSVHTPSRAWIGRSPLSPRHGGCWATWQASPVGRRVWALWCGQHPVLATVPLGELLVPVSGPVIDEIQAVLVSLAQGDPNGDRAAHLLLVQLRPGLVRLARSFSRSASARSAHSSHAHPSHAHSSHPRSDDYGSWAAEVQSVFLETVLRHRLDRRPRRIAANLLFDTRQRVTRSRASSPPAEAVPRMARRMLSSSAADATSVALRAALASELASLSGVEPSPRRVAARQQTAEIAFRAWFLDEARDDIATSYGLTTNQVNVRLHRLRRGLQRRLEGSW